MMYPPLITEEERRAYGDEALSVMERKAREVVHPVVQELNQQAQQLRQELQQVKATDVYSMLDQNLPDWREINRSDEWKEWLTVPDVYSGMVKQQLLNQAFAAGDATRVLTFFRGFLGQHPQQSTATPRRATSREQLPIFTTAQISKFYDDVRRGRYSEQQKANIELQLHRAVTEGRVRQVH
jgi:hypothetical protein